MTRALLCLLFTAAIVGPVSAHGSASSKLPFNRENVTRVLEECHIGGAYGDSMILVAGPLSRRQRRCLYRKLVLPPDLIVISV